MTLLFWISLFFLFYHLFFYGIILRTLCFFKREKDLNINNLTTYPTITVLCPAYNEEDVIEKKIESFLALDYPKDKIEMIVISDDSTDRTNEIVKKYVKSSNIQLVIQKPRKGKQNGHNLVEPYIKSEFVLSTDANSIFEKDAVKKLVETMHSDKNIGLVSGALRLKKKDKEDSGEGLYWRYESSLKVMESKFHSIIVANGALFLIRREYFTQIHPASADDFERTLLVLENGSKAKYNPYAVVIEEVTEKAIDEINRKIRIITLQGFSLKRHISLLNPFKHPKIAFMLFSHKILRWLLPVFSFLILLSNAFLLGHIFYEILFLFQILIYLTGSLELLLEKRGSSIKIFKLPAYFVAMNYSALIALFNFIRGKEFYAWDTVRQK
jgi:cellulose synthase/poly-beta-1,6-N-acetylglucosamine synthase-like glycosyltransferase